MSIISAVPVLYCHQFEKSLGFYQHVLRFVIVNQQDEAGVVHWVHLMNNDTSIMLQRADSPVIDPASSHESGITLYFFVTELDAIHQYIRANDETAGEILVTKYNMREFSLCDPEGNQVTLGEKQ